MNDWYFCYARQILFASMLLGPLARSAEVYVETSSFAQVQVIKVTRYDDPIAQVLNGDRVDQARFAEIALEVLVNAYPAELRRSSCTSKRRLRLENRNAPLFNGRAIFERNIADKASRFLGRGAHVLSVKERVANRSTRSDIGSAFASSSALRYSGSDGLQCLFTDRQHLKLKKMPV